MFEGYSGLNCLHTLSLNSYIEIFADFFFKCFDKVESQSVQLYPFVICIKYILKIKQHIILSSSDFLLDKHNKTEQI